ncbi:MAG: serine/threonine protein kinase [Casimicrobiaceae bacterium]
MNTPITTASSALPTGTRLGEFEITGVVGEGGFGIVYSARDTTLDRIVAIKEYLPAAFASRTERGTVEVRLPEHEKTFRTGLASFINEAKMLARFSHPGLVEVFRFWEGNGTAYMAMRYYRGVTLRETIRTTPEAITEDWLRQTLDPILLALTELHQEHCFHRDIAPDNIMVLPNGRSVLMDFGAARRIIGGMTRALTTVLKPGYAPIEQYSDDGSMPQGAWTDIYAIGGVLYHAMTGKVPVQAISRMMTDPLKDVATIARRPYSENLCRVVMKCLAVMPEHRYQSIDELRSALGWVTPAVGPTIILPSERVLPPTEPSPVPTPATRIADAPAPMTRLDPMAIPSDAGAITPAADAPAEDPLASLLAGAPTAPVAAAAPTDAGATVTGRCPSTPLERSPGLGNAPEGMISAPGGTGTSASKAPSSATAIAVVGAVLVIALAAGGYFLFGRSEPADTPVAVVPKEVPEPAPAVPQPLVLPGPSAVEAAKEATKDPLPPPAEQRAPESPSAPSAAPPPASTAPAAAVASADAPREKDAPAIDSKAQTVDIGTVRLVVSNGWAHVFVNGEQRGTVPPLTTLTLPPGKHTIELRNPSAPPVVRSVDVQAGKSMTIRHSF